ncbi:hypothetical protein HA051_08310 [Chromobacterium vaccinii]|nr:hypothetical protein [Chromobacterium vaccinii]
MEKIKNTLELLTKIGLPFGAILIWVYMIHIHYFPRGLSVGDSISLLILALVWSITISIYLLMTYIAADSLLTIAALSPIKPIQEIISDAGIDPPKVPTAIINGVALIACTYQVYKFSQENIYTTAISIGLFSIYMLLHKHIKNIVLDIVSQTNKHYSTRSQTIETKLIVTSFALIPLLAIILSSTPFFFSLLKLGTEITHLRTDSATIYTKPPYSLILEDYIKSKKSFNEYRSFENVKILFYGIGTMTVISLDGKDKGKTLEIPNESIIIEKIPKPKN